MGNCCMNSKIEEYQASRSVSSESTVMARESSLLDFSAIFNQLTGRSDTKIPRTTSCESVVIESSRSDD